MDEDGDLHMCADEPLIPYDTDFSAEREKVPFIGLNNLGNTCFFNSIVQILFYCPGFRQNLAPIAKHLKAISGDIGKEATGESNERTFEAKDKCAVLLELCDLFAQMRRNQLSLVEETPFDADSLQSVRPEKLMDSLRKSYPAFEPYAQQDAQECLRCILSILQDAISFIRGKFVKVKDAEIIQSGCKVYGGRNADAAGSTTTEQSQIENRDPNRPAAKTVSRSSASRKRGMRFILRRPLKLKLGSYSQNAQSDKEQHDSCGESSLKGPLQHEVTPLSDRQNNNNTTSLSAKGTGCFARLKKAVSEPENADKNIKRSEGLIGTPVKRPSTDDPPSSPPMKRKKLSLSNGIRNFYKPGSRPKSLMALDKKKSYTVIKSEKRSKTNPFKVVAKPDASVYRLLSDEPASGKLPEKGKSETRPNSPVLGGRKSPVVADKLVVTEDANSIQENKASYLTDFIEEIFQGQLVNEIRCMECENSLLRKEPFMDISLPVKEDSAEDKDCASSDESLVKKEKTCSVGWGLTQFTSTEALEGDNKYYCEHCRRYVEGERRIQFSKLPPVLTLHLKRFTTSKPVAGGDAFCSMVSKINSLLSVPRQISLRDWATNSCDEAKANYSLFGIVIHSGVTISSGHYLSYVHLDRSSTNPTVLGNEEQVVKLSSYEESWLEADDERTRILTEKELDSILSPPGTEGVSRTPYLLFYQRDESP